MRVYGGSDKVTFQKVGLNSRLDTLQAAILLAKLPYLDEEIDLRQKIAKRYKEAFEKSMTDERVPTMVHYRKTLTQQPVFREVAVLCEGAEKAAKEVVCLPLNPFLKFDEVQYVVESVIKSLRKKD